MIVITISEVVEIHEKLIAVTGGSPGLRDMGLLESAVLGCYQSFGGIDLYPSVIEKAARMAFAICKNHPFIDGNKRVAVTSMLVILRMNDISLAYAQRELVMLGLGIADGGIDCDNVRQIRVFLKQRYHVAYAEIRVYRVQSLQYFPYQHKIIRRIDCQAVFAPFVAAASFNPSFISLRPAPYKKSHVFPLRRGSTFHVSLT